MSLRDSKYQREEHSSVCLNNAFHNRTVIAVAGLCSSLFTRQQLPIF